MTTESILENAVKGGVALVSNRVGPFRKTKSPLLPVIDYKRISTVPSIHHSGHANFSQVRISFRIFGRDYDEVKNVRSQLLSTLRGYSSGDVKIVFEESEIDLPEEEVGRTGLVIDFLVLASE